jgi:hypothetical protein
VESAKQDFHLLSDLAAKKALFCCQQKKSNTGIEIEQCRYLIFKAKPLVWRAKFLQQDSSKVFLPYLELPASVFQRLAPKAPDRKAVCDWPWRWR